MSDMRRKLHVVQGGREETRRVDVDNPFEVAVAAALGFNVSQEKYFAAEVWSALTNVQWREDISGETYCYTFRAAGDLVAALRGEGNYMEWYCCAPAGVVSLEIAKAMKAKGWVPS